MLSAVASLLVTVGLLALGLWALRRFVPGAVRADGAAGLPFRLLRRLATGPKHAVALVQVGGRVLVVTLAEDGARMLTELDGEDRALALGEPAARPAAVPARPAFLRFLPVVALLLLAPAAAGAQAAARPATAASAVAGPVAPKVTLTIGQGADQLQLSGAVGVVVFMGAMTLLPAMFLLMTSFTRILIVLHFVRSALGTQSAPPGQLLVALSVLLTGVVMQPVIQQANTDAIQPYLSGQLPQTEAYHRALAPLKTFMIANTRDKDLGMFAELTGQEEADSVEALPILTVTAAFVTSELRTAFQMGFVIFLPFVVVDLIVASVLMSMGMFMLPPVMISLPFKLMLFVLADGWTLVVQRLVTGFQA
ncbi:MAG: flagellar type III secretion system pore protein FliP [Gemmatimonadales bacterium]|nr:flagellar type III secretion system pore protein FliP [Gemmatimonadales bacterium]